MQTVDVGKCLRYLGQRTNVPSVLKKLVQINFKRKKKQHKWKKMTEDKHFTQEAI